MTPSWLYNNSNITGPHSLNPQLLEFLHSNVARQRILQVQLVAPNVLTSTQCISVTLTIAMNTELADSGDHDPLFGISDGNLWLDFKYLIKTIMTIFPHAVGTKVMISVVDSEIKIVEMVLW